MPSPQALDQASYRPLHPEPRDQGDPFLLVAPSDEAAPFRYYVYVTGEDEGSGGAFPVYGSSDLLRWEALGWSLEGAMGRAHWAPCVRYLPGRARPYVMLYSLGAGLGEAAHIGHAIRRADATAPEGPFRDSGHILTPDLDFAIDPDVYDGPDGRPMLAFATDFVADTPLGTGIVEAPIADDLTHLSGPATVLARARYDWQVYDASRKMPWKEIPGVDWARDTVRWHTVEAPSGGLRSPAGRAIYLYSGGCFFDYYAVGAVERDRLGTLRPLTEASQGFVLRPRPEAGFYAPGHCCWFTVPHGEPGAPAGPAGPGGPGGETYLMYHARYGAPDAPRQFSIARLRWDEAGRAVADPPAQVK